jgi:arylsulfatase A-like enzyme/Flp pilus assembly protein TadD
VVAVALAIALALTLGTAIWVFLRGRAGDSDDARRPRNVVLVSVDTLRADHLSAYGESVPVSTPHMDRLATEGVLFEQVQSVSPTTLPSHASLFTGLIPPMHGVRDNVGFYLAEGSATLASRLGSHGYRAGGFVGAFVLDSRFGISQGFETYYDDFEAMTDDVAGGFVSQRPGSEVLERALAWIDEVRAAPDPFFAFVHFYDPHTPYDPPAPFAASEDSPSALYHAEVAYTDSLVGKLLDFLDERELSDDTLVVLTSDHGESLGEHGEKTHGFFVYESTLRIPLLLRYPGAPKGTRVKPFVRIVDIAPTILDLLGAPPLENVNGESLVSLIEEPHAEWDSPGYAETFLPRLHYGWSELQSLRRGSHKLVLAPKPELYDLAEDPDETINRIDEEPTVARALRDELDQLRAASGSNEERSVASLDDETRARLASLGYVSAKPLTESRALADPKDRIGLYDALNDPELKSLEPGDRPAFGDALARLRRVVEEEPTIPRAYVLYGELLLKAGDREGAEKTFARLATEDPRNFEAHFGLGVARQERGNLDGAEAAYRAALAVEPLNTKGHFRLADVAEARGDQAAAEKWLRDALEISPNLFLRERLASLLLRAGKRDEARTVLDQMSGEGEENPTALYNLGQAALMDGDAKGALEMFRGAAEASPEDADIQQGIANAHAALGEMPQAVEAYRRAIALSPCFAAAHTNLGTTLWQLGEKSDAIRAMRRGVECAPSYLPGYQNLAAAYYESGEVAKAIEALEQALVVAPENAELSQLLAELREFQRRNQRN